MDFKSFVGQKEALDICQSAYNKVLDKAPQILDIEGDEGSGRRRLLKEFEATLSQPALVITFPFTEMEDGLKVMLRLYAETYRAFQQLPDLKSKVSSSIEEMLVSAEEPKKQWLSAFKEGLEKDAPDTQSESFQVTLPRFSPYLAFQEIVSIISSHTPIILNFVEVDMVLSFTYWVFMTAMIDRIRFEKLPVLVAFTHRHVKLAEDPSMQPLIPRIALLNSLSEGVDVNNVKLATWDLSLTETAISEHYSNNRFPNDLAKQVLAFSSGNPGIMTQIFERMEDLNLLVQADDEHWLWQSEDNVLKWEDLIPAIDVENKGLAKQALSVAALEGSIFTANVLIENLNQEKDTVIDILDEMEDVVEELVFHEGVQSWLYRFKKPLFFNYYRNHASSLSEIARQEQSKSLGELFEQKYVSKAVEYALKAARLWREAGDVRRYTGLMGLAASAERPDVLQMGVEVVKSFPRTRISRALYKGLHLTFFEKTVPNSHPEPLLRLLDDVEAWAKHNQDEEVIPWLSFYRARLFQRMGRLQQATESAEIAQKGFELQSNAVKEGDALALLALIALGMGQVGVANEYVSRSLKKTNFPPVRSYALFAKGLVHKSKGEIKQALDTLKEVLDLSARTGALPLHIDSGINIAECLLIAGNPAESVSLLGQLQKLAQQTKQLPRERVILSLLGKAQATLQDFQKATECASSALKIAREMKHRHAEAVDLLDLGIFSLARGQFEDAAVYLRESEKIATELSDKGLIKEVMFHHAMVCTGLKDYPKAIRLYEDALEMSKELKDNRRQANILFNIGGLYFHQEEFAKARTYFDQATPLIDQNGTQEEKAALKKAKEQLELKLN